MDERRSRRAAESALFEALWVFKIAATSLMARIHVSGLLVSTASRTPVSEVFERNAVRLQLASFNRRRDDSSEVEFCSDETM